MLRSARKSRRPLPAGADAVVMQERCQTDGKVVLIEAVPGVGGNIRPLGQDIRSGATVLNAGQRLRAQDLGLVVQDADPAQAMLVDFRKELAQVGGDVGQQLLRFLQREGGRLHRVFAVIAQRIGFYRDEEGQLVSFTHEGDLRSLCPIREAGCDAGVSEQGER